MATPAAVRLGLSRGRSSRLCNSSSPVTRRSRAGHSMAIVKIRPGKTTAGRKTSRGTVWPRPVSSHDGMMRRAPSSQPMYQSGCTA